MGTLEDKAELTRLRDRLQELLKRPPKHSNWSAHRAMDFKKAHMAAQKLVAKPSAKPGELSSHINTMSGYFL